MRRYVATRPAIYYRLLPASRRPFAVRDTTELVLEGIPRSGNSFAEAAFRIAQGDSDGNRLQLAHHLHAPAQLRAARRLGLPAVLLIREPIGVCTSLVMKLPEVFLPEDALSEYCWFYRDLEPIAADFVIADFDTVRSDFGAVIAAINRRYGTTYEEFVHTPASEAAAFDLVDRLTARRVGAAMTSYSPQQPLEKQRLRAQKQRSIAEHLETTPALAPLVADARALYARLRAQAQAV